MCGIYGTTQEHNDLTVSRKLGVIKERGPDVSKFIRIDNVVLGHNRLSILDLDSRSNQPLRYHHLTIVFNGEIYNYTDIKSALIKKGYKFQTESDTEVLCAAYLEYGEKCLEKLNGMFAFVIYNSKSKQFFGARDRLGQKPLYYFIDGATFEFASQIKQIISDKNLEIDNDAHMQFLFRKYIPGTKSIFKKVKKLGSAKYFIYDIKNKKLTINTYWTHKNISLDPTIKFDDAKVKLNQLLEDSIRLRLRADVPLGMFLSGGIDSSLVAAKAQHQLQRKLRTFSIKFDEELFDETKYAVHVAKVIDSEHSIINCNISEGLNVIQNYTKYFDEPFSDSSAIPMMLLSQHTSKHLTVALSGDAGDESFIGYDRYKYFSKYKNVYQLPLAFRKAISNLLTIPSSQRLRIIAKLLSQKNFGSFYLRSMYRMNDAWIQNPNFLFSANEEEFLNTKHANAFELMSGLDILSYLTDDINTKVDRSSMAHSLEVRAPLIDHRIVEFARSLPTSFKYQKDRPKRILRSLLYDEIPTFDFQRPKSGFSVPLDSWFRSELKEFVYSHLNLRGLSDIPNINVPETTKLIADHMSGKKNNGSIMWTLLSYKLWAEEYL